MPADQLSTEVKDNFWISLPQGEYEGSWEGDKVIFRIGKHSFHIFSQVRVGSGAISVKVRIGDQQIIVVPNLG